MRAGPSMDVRPGFGSPASGSDYVPIRGPSDLDATAKFRTQVLLTYFAVPREFPTNPAIMNTAAMPIRNPPAKSVYGPCTQLCRTRPVASMRSPMGSNRLSLR